MIKGLFFDGVDMGSYNFPINVGIKLSLPVLSYTANAEFRVDNLAEMRAEEA